MSLHQNKKPGFTIVELLIVIGILAVIGAILVPTVRVLNADRRIRESARMVNMFASSVRDEAIVDGESAFMMVRNTNDPDRCYEMRRMRILAPYAGNTIGDFATIQQVESPNGSGRFYFVIDLEAPLPTSTLNAINIGDTIKFNYRNVSYRILDKDNSLGLPDIGSAVNPGTNRYTLDYVLESGITTTHSTGVPVVDPVPPVNQALPFQVFRRPIPINAGKLVMPGNQYIDMSKSGPVDFADVLPARETFFDDDYAAGQLLFDEGFGSVVVVFDGNGSVDRFYTRYGTPTEEIYFPSESIFMLVATDHDDDNLNVDNLNRLDNLWVTIGRNNGAVYTGEIAQTDPSANSLVRISNARGIARKRLQDLQ